MLLSRGEARALDLRARTNMACRALCSWRMPAGVVPSY